MATPLKTYLDRSLGVLKRNTTKVLQMDLAPNPPPLSLFSFNSRLPPVSPISDFALGSDSDIGGVSTAALTPVSAAQGHSRNAAGGAPPNPLDGAAPAWGGEDHVAFHGNLSLHIPSAYAGRIRTGYAAFRNRTRPTFFGEDTWDLELYSHLRIEVAYRGYEAWRSRWVVNIQTDGPVKSDLFQHRLDLPPTPFSTSSPAPLDPLHCTGLQFATLHLPISSFVLTNSGQTSETQVQMMRARIRTVGFALLGGGRDDATAPPEAVAAAAASASTGRRIASGGWGKPTDDEFVDAELEELMASDQPLNAAPATPTAPSSAPSAGGYHRVGQTAQPAGGYHRVGAAAAAPVTPAAEPEAEAVAESDVQGQEGYYELCIRSVQAVKWDPEME